MSPSPPPPQRSPRKILVPRSKRTQSKNGKNVAVTNDTTTTITTTNDLSPTKQPEQPVQPAPSKDDPMDATAAKSDEPQPDGFKPPVMQRLIFKKPAAPAWRQKKGQAQEHGKAGEEAKAQTGSPMAAQDGSGKTPGHKFHWNVAEVDLSKKQLCQSCFRSKEMIWKGCQNNFKYSIEDIVESQHKMEEANRISEEKFLEAQEKYAKSQQALEKLRDDSEKQIYDIVTQYEQDAVEISRLRERNNEQTRIRLDYAEKLKARDKDAVELETLVQELEEKVASEERVSDRLRNECRELREGRRVDNVEMEGANTQLQEMQKRLDAKDADIKRLRETNRMFADDLFQTKKTQERFTEYEGIVHALRPMIERANKDFNYFERTELNEQDLENVVEKLCEDVLEYRYDSEPSEKDQLEEDMMAELNKPNAAVESDHDNAPSQSLEAELQQAEAMESIEDATAQELESASNSLQAKIAEMKILQDSFNTEKVAMEKKIKDLQEHNNVQKSRIEEEKQRHEATAVEAYAKQRQAEDTLAQEREQFAATVKAGNGEIDVLSQSFKSRIQQLEAEAGSHREVEQQHIAAKEKLAAELASRQQAFDSEKAQLQKEFESTKAHAEQIYAAVVAERDGLKESLRVAQEEATSKAKVNEADFVPRSELEEVKKTLTTQEESHKKDAEQLAALKSIKDQSSVEISELKKKLETDAANFEAELAKVRRSAKLGDATATSLANAKQAAEDQCTKLNADLAQLRKKSKEQAADLGKRVAELRKKSDDEKQQIDIKSAELKKMAEEKSQVETELAALNKVAEEKEQITSKLAALATTSEAAKTTADTQIAQLQKSLEEMEQVMTELAQLKKASEEAKTTAATKDEELQKLLQEKNSIAKELAGLKKTSEEATKKSSAEMLQLKKELEEKRSAAFHAQLPKSTRGGKHSAASSHSDSNRIADFQKSLTARQNIITEQTAIRETLEEEKQSLETRIVDLEKDLEQKTKTETEVAQLQQSAAEQKAAHEADLARLQESLDAKQSLEAKVAQLEKSFAEEKKSREEQLAKLQAATKSTFQFGEAQKATDAADGKAAFNFEGVTEYPPKGEKPTKKEEALWDLLRDKAEDFAQQYAAFEIDEGKLHMEKAAVEAQLADLKESSANDMEAIEEELEEVKKLLAVERKCSVEDLNFKSRINGSDEKSKGSTETSSVENSKAEQPATAEDKLQRKVKTLENQINKQRQKHKKAIEKLEADHQRCKNAEITALYEKSEGRSRKMLVDWSITDEQYRKFWDEHNKRLEADIAAKDASLAAHSKQRDFLHRQYNEQKELVKKLREDKSKTDISSTEDAASTHDNLKAQLDEMEARYKKSAAEELELQKEKLSAEYKLSTANDLALQKEELSREFRESATNNLKVALDKLAADHKLSAAKDLEAQKNILSAEYKMSSASDLAIQREKLSTEFKESAANELKVRMDKMAAENKLSAAKELEAQKDRLTAEYKTSAANELERQKEQLLAEYRASATDNVVEIPPAKVPATYNVSTTCIFLLTLAYVYYMWVFTENLRSQWELANDVSRQLLFASQVGAAPFSLVSFALFVFAPFLGAIETVISIFMPRVGRLPLLLQPDAKLLWLVVGWQSFKERLGYSKWVWLGLFVVFFAVVEANNWEMVEGDMWADFGRGHSMGITLFDF